MTNLETRIADALASENIKPSVFSDLLIEIEDALPLNAKEIEATRIRMVDPTYPCTNATIAKSALEKLELERSRLDAAQSILRQRYAHAEHRECQAAWLAKITRAVEGRDAIARALIGTYADFLSRMLPLLEKSEETNRTIRNLSQQTARIKGLPLLEEIVPRLLQQVRLPDPNGGMAWPTPASENAFAVAVASTMVVPRHDQRYSANWAEAKKAEDKAKLDYWEKRNALQAEQQAEAKREFEKSKQQGAR